MQCTKSADIVSLAKNNEQLHKLLYQLLNDIQVTFNNQVNQQPSVEFVRGKLYLAPDVRIVELKPFEFMKYFTPKFRGAYNVGSGKIFLQRGKWCLSTILHETLHSVSTFGLNLETIIDFAKRNLWIREGLTEFFTGYVLFKKYPNCYEAWKKSKFQKFCPISYPREVILWSTLCQFIPITVPAKLYFWNPSLSLNDSYYQFIEAIRCEIPDFPDLLCSGNVLRKTEFRGVCAKHFGKNFRRIEISRKRSLDFTKLR